MSTQAILRSQLCTLPSKSLPISLPHLPLLHPRSSHFRSCLHSSAASTRLLLHDAATSKSPLLRSFASRARPQLSKSHHAFPILSRSRQVLSRHVHYGSPTSTTNKKLYPERLLIYHAGTGKTVFIGCLKMTTIFLFVFSTLILAPAFFQARDWAMVAGVLIGGTLPMAFVGWITTPFVTYIHMRVPIYARRSKDILMRFTRTLSPDAELDLTTMRFLGTPGITRVKAGELRPAKKRLGIANLIRIPPPSFERSWWRRDLRQFYVGPSKTGGTIRETDVWDQVLASIKKGMGSGKTGR